MTVILKLVVVNNDGVDDDDEDDVISTIIWNISINELYTQTGITTSFSTRRILLLLVHSPNSPKY